MKTAVVLLACLAAVSADCNYLHREKIKHQWNQAYHHNREDFGIALWRHMFHEEPSSRDYFSRVRGDDERHPAFLAHSDRVIGGLNTVISVIDDEETLQAELAHLKMQHDARMIPAGAFKLFKNALMHVVPALITKCFDEHAWSDCFDEVIYPGIVGVAAEL